MRPAAAVVALLLPGLAAAGAAVDAGELARAVDRVDVDAVRAMGPEALEPLADLYAAGPRDRKVAVALVWYGLGWKSERAKGLLLDDLDTQDPELRLDVQWALGRVSSDPVVVERLLVTMRRDPNPLFRDKAACALASDQIHLDAPGRLAELEGLVAALEDETPQVRRIAIQALRILTGQDKGFQPGAPPAARRAAVERWRTWLDEARAAL